MSTLKSRTLLAALSVVSALFSFGPAFAQELPHHVLFQRIVPVPAEADTGPPDFEPLDNWFGADVAIRDGFAFASMRKTNGTGQVAVFTQQGTSGHWTRTATIVASDRTEGDEFGRTISYRDGLLIVGVQPLGATGDDHGTYGASIAIANNVLLVGSPHDRACFRFDVGCVGEANFSISIDLSKRKPNSNGVSEWQ